MKQIQKRYLYSAGIASLFFIISYGVLDINILISLLLTIVFYAGGIFLFKEKDIRELNGETVNQYYFLASRVGNYSNYIDDVDIKEDINTITSLVDQILVSLEQRPKKVEQVFDFFDYYLDITYKLLYKYTGIIKKKKTSKESDEFLNKMPTYMDAIVKAFDKQFKNMQEAKMLDINSEIRVFENTVGIKNSDLKVGDEDAGK